ncbi:hypothetical protein K6L44_11525 [Gluconacetobacter entanii]|uniref:hypothetical protein n=1 Tax=Gluconacetobacter entanii TaxID=108528 RepID=UPI001C93335F|nr:hypothetical protein [Gluconacetobacter entanii]MBY4640604.1 hypothetical protein [Gluconacetobacter entanii]MCW4578949.1 hypothetical protein [Gluconacetobacter entanii]MCW4585740.1 hypothetical protein [Gluconacetobacter entanii]
MTSLTLKEFLTKEAGNPANFRNYKRQFAAVMLERIGSDTITGEDFLSLSNEVFPKNAIARKMAVEAWDNFTFQQTVREVTGQ